MKHILYISLFLLCSNIFIATFTYCESCDKNSSRFSKKPTKQKRLDRHSKILHKKQIKLELRDSGQVFPDRYGYDPQIPICTTSLKMYLS